MAPRGHPLGSLKLAVIGTFYRRWENNEAIINALLGQSRPADEHWIMCEDDEDTQNFVLARGVGSLPGLRLITLPTPRDADGRYEVIPYSHKINWSLDRTDADAIVYLDNGSLPAPDKYRAMLEGLESNPEWGATYCGQHRTGVSDHIFSAGDTIYDAFCVLNYTQVMHRRTDDRWTLDMEHADPDLADAHFWRSLHASLGPFYPVGDGVLDNHHMPSSKAAGL